VETAKIPPLADAMVTADERFDHLKQLQKSPLRAPADHPDLDPPHEALQLAEMFHEIARADSVTARTPTSCTSSPTRKRRRRASNEPCNAPRRPTGADGAFKLVANACASCHKAHRD